MVLRWWDLLRKNQVEIKVRRFGDKVPESFSEDKQVISVYADSNNLYEALSIAYSELMKEIQRYENVPSFGRVEVTNNITNDRLM